jgi:hypothetical protein
MHIRKPDAYDISDGATGNGDDIFGDNKELLPADNPKRTFGITDRAIQFVEERVKESNPFFMQLSYYAPHVSYFAMEETLEKYKIVPPGKKSLPEDIKVSV